MNQDNNKSSNPADVPTDKSDKYVPPKIWVQDKDNGGKFASINRPTAGARHDKALPIGTAPLQLYSLNTPNGIKVNILLEELAELGITGAEYDAYKIDISAGEQFGSGFVAINPNSKIPALVDHSNRETGEPITVFESAAIVMYLAEKFGKFMPLEVGKARADCLSWVMWQMGSTPFLGGGLGIFMRMPLNRWSIQSTAIRWKPNVSLMYLISISKTMNIWVATQKRIIILRTWLFGRGMDSWYLANSTMPQSFYK